MNKSGKIGVEKMTAEATKDQKRERKEGKFGGGFSGRFVRGDAYLFQLGALPLHIVLIVFVIAVRGVLCH